MQITNKEYTKSVNVFGSIIDINEKNIIVLMNTPNEKDDLFFDQDELVVQTLNDNYETSEHMISNFESNSTLNQNQWLITFDRKINA